MIQSLVTQELYKFFPGMYDIRLASSLAIHAWSLRLLAHFRTFIECNEVYLRLSLVDETSSLYWCLLNFVHCNPLVRNSSPTSRMFQNIKTKYVNKIVVVVYLFVFLLYFV